MTCTGPACNRPVKARGLCSTHYRASRRRDDLKPIRPKGGQVRIDTRVSPWVVELIMEQGLGLAGGARHALEVWAEEVDIRRRTSKIVSDGN